VREIAGRMGCNIVKVYKDHGISGAKGRDKRPAFDALCRDATKRQFDVVMAWSVDRLGRSLQDLMSFLSELHVIGIDLFLHQQGFDTTTPAGKAMFQMMGVFAEFERAIIQERVRAGAGAGQERRQAARQTADSPSVGKPHPCGSGQAWAHRRRAQDRRSVWCGSRYGAADQPPFRGRKRGRVKRQPKSG
jgi:DNA invertase Pin-like site-specific DNA recombinase